MMRTRAACILGAVAALMLAGCGKKPGFVDAPPGVDPDPFPRMYPNPVSEAGGRSYPTPASEGAAPAPVLPRPSTDPFDRIYRNPDSEVQQ